MPRGTRHGGACQASKARAFATTASWMAARAQVPTAGQAEAMANLIRRTDMRTSPPIFNSLSRMVPQVASARSFRQGRSELPVQQVTKIEMFLNMKTAKALRHRHSNNATRPRRRGDRINHRSRRLSFAALHQSGCGTKRRTAASTNSVAIGGTADMPRTRRARRSDAFDPEPT
jgi:hypothetical protein